MQDSSSKKRTSRTQRCARDFARASSFPSATRKDAPSPSAAGFSTSPKNTSPKTQGQATAKKTSPTSFPKDLYNFARVRSSTRAAALENTPTVLVEGYTEQAGVVLKRKPETKETQQKQQRSQRIRETLACAEAFYRKALFAHEGEKARRYLKQRGLDKACAERFALGWADSNTKLFFEAMTAENRSDKDLVDAGLVVEKKNFENATLRARFRSRILFPVSDAQGRTIAFGGRFLDTAPRNTSPKTQGTSDSKEDFVPPKYLNSPETALFSKGQNLYNFARVRSSPRAAALAQNTPTVLVEGYTDVLALDKAGFATSLASLGTALSEQQLLLLWQCADTPVLCFDGDKAGVLAAKRAVLRALPLLDERRNLKLFFLPEGQDPDSFVATFGIERWREALRKTETVSEFLWRDEKKKIARALPHDAQAMLLAYQDAKTQTLRRRRSAAKHRSKPQIFRSPRNAVKALLCSPNSNPSGNPNSNPSLCPKPRCFEAGFGL